MKLSSRDAEGRLVDIDVSWGDHLQGCPRCQEVDVNVTATLSRSCAMGAALLAEHLSALQAPVEKKRRKEVEAWAVNAGTFIKPRAKLQHTKYVDADKSDDSIAKG